ncbi:MAG: aminoacyl-histidine dipeptidase [Clostridiales bacterium]|jgi:dipeptidase D|nr:aminoacyl-histidine dipeptidase [Clostridiales bacterium]
MVLKNLQPASFFKFFEEISRIPRGSGNEKAVSDFIAEFARGKGLRVEQDGFHNLIIYKPATPGYEGREPVILQGHLDMVCEKNRETVHDFLKDPLKLRIDGDFISAEGTTLGADDGIALAAGMALLDAGDIAHPPLEVVFTADEEAGMSGAENLNAKLLRGRRLINMDTSHEGTFFSGCAGGVRALLTLPVEREPAAEGSAFIKMEVSGLKGGHSGEDIILDRGNSLRILSRLLVQLEKAAVDFRTLSASGGMKINAIPREAEAVVAVPQDDADAVFKIAEAFTKELANEYRVSDPKVKIGCARVDKTDAAHTITREGTRKLIAALLLLPNGVLGMSQDIPGLTETSCSVGVLELNENAAEIHIMPRSSVMSRLQAVKEQISKAGEVLNAKVSFSHEYPGWEYDSGSALRKTAAEVYRGLYGKEPVVTAVHGGLECGLFAGKMPGVDMISFGPNATGAHTPDERLSISSTARVWTFLTALLKNL